MHLLDIYLTHIHIYIYISYRPSMSPRVALRGTAAPVSGIYLYTYMYIYIYKCTYKICKRASLYIHAYKL